VVCDHPDNILNQAGADFLKIVPTTWDDIKFISGYPGDYVAIAKRSGDKWFVGVMNNSVGKSIELKTGFLSAGTYEAEIWADTKNSDNEPKELKKANISIKSGETMKVTMAKNGGFVAVIKRK
jgi:alpha-glucosidase